MPAVASLSRPPRISGFNYIGLYCYFLTFCTHGREAFFLVPTNVSQTLIQFRKTAQHEGFELLAYCFMPDHVHLLVEALNDHSDLRRLAKLGKQRSGGIHARQGHGPRWQPGYYDRVLREGEDLKQIARYILNNPVRAGLVATPLEYPYVGSDRWSMAELIVDVM